MRRLNKDEVRDLKLGVQAAFFAVKHGILPAFAMPHGQDQREVTDYLLKEIRIMPSKDRTTPWSVVVNVDGFELSLNERDNMLAPNSKGNRFVDVVVVLFLAKLGWTFNFHDPVWSTPERVTQAKGRYRVYHDRGGDNVLSGIVMTMLRA
jgi:hypothetical protein